MSEPVLDRQDFFAMLGLALVTPLLLAPYLFPAPTPLIYPESALGTDLPREIWPLAHFIKQALAQGTELPLWRPYLLSGAPIAGHPISPLFYPPHWLVLALPIPLALNLDVALHLVWMGIGAYLYLRLESQVRWQAALAGGLIFSVSPKWIAHLSGGHLPMIAALSWWPWIWLAWSRYLGAPQSRWLLVAGVGFASQILNHGTFFAMSLSAVAVLCLWKLMLSRLAMLRRVALGWLVSLGTAVSLGAVHLAPFLFLVGHSTRAGISEEQAAFGSLPPPLILNVLLPPQLKFPEWFLYPGAGAISLALVGLVLIKSRRKWIASAVILTGILLALGSHTPIFGIMYRYLPGYSVLRVPARWWLISLSAIALLAAWGLDEWLTSAQRPKRLRLILFTSALFYGLIGGLAVIFNQSIGYAIFPSTLLMATISILLMGRDASWKLAMITIVILLDLWWSAEFLIRPEAEAGLIDSDPVITLLQEAAARGERSLAPYGGVSMSDLAAFDLRATDGYDSFALDHYAQLLTFAGGCDFFGYAAAVPATAGLPRAAAQCPTFEPEPQILRMLNVRYILLPDRTEIPQSNLTFISEGLYVYELPGGFGRGFGVGQGTVHDPQACPDALASIDLSSTAIVEVELPFEPGSNGPQVLRSRRTTNAEDFSVRVEEPGLLVRSEAWAPGWTATIDGRSADVLKVNCSLQGVWLQPGDEEVIFQYAPKGFKAGLLISLAAVITMVIGFVWWR